MTNRRKVSGFKNPAAGVKVLVKKTTVDRSYSLPSKVLLVSQQCQLNCVYLREIVYSLYC